MPPEQSISEAAAGAAAGVDGARAARRRLFFPDLPLFPMFVSLAGKSCLVVGAGEVGRRKADALRAYGADVTLADGFDPASLDGKELVVAATGSGELNRAVAALCRERRIPVNAVDDPEASSFVFGAVAKKGCVAAAVSTAGRSPVAAQHLRDRIAQLLTERFVAAVEHLGSLRTERRDAAFYRKELERCLGAET